jgi:2-polyprenyl-3-methyl-5-hydroxy-6-metoxy-1,4-benzoquinol methylase
MRSKRWASEAEFFDRLAESQLGKIPWMDPAILRRYSGRLRPWFNKEFRFERLGDLTGLHVLDVGCGDGSNSVLLASRGARVTGIDISSRSIELATERARLAGVQDRVTFHCSPLELADFPEDTFDVIWGDGILHHLIPELEGVLAQLERWAKPGAQVIFSEPLSLSPALRRLRSHIPIHEGATPDERPLESAELNLILQRLPGTQMRHFSLLSWFNRFVMKGTSYERASAARRLATDLLHAADYALLSLPGFKNLGGMVVLSSTMTKQAKPAGAAEPEPVRRAEAG